MRTYDMAAGAEMAADHASNIVESEREEGAPGLLLQRLQEIADVLERLDDSITGDPTAVDHEVYDLAQLGVEIGKAMETARADRVRRQEMRVRDAERARQEIAREPHGISCYCPDCH